ncbi:hypothetical protein P43SY_001972 [Pythium insidiosum]|uniref:HAT C-terminal dimerisation domain-containing protein n=1 Tax=Pythium insidiosum TaxID=114742 RepID=A0AAD5LPL4_PYTIN|nr:hypothetical protein P43SY_001972 [Pythium insidiosum]
MADVVVSFRDIYYAFAHNMEYGHSLIPCVESRWSQCEQPPFLLAFFPHPTFREHAKIVAKAKPVVAMVVEDAVVYYFRRFFRDQPKDGIRSEFTMWFKGSGFDVDMTEFSVALVAEYGSRLAGTRPKLSQLAIRVLSVTVNTATCERLFSSLGLILSAARNKTEAEKARKLYLVGKRFREEHDPNPSQKKRMKRIIDPIDDVSEAIDTVPADSDDGKNDQERPGVESCVRNSFRFMQTALAEIFVDEEIENDYER